jgi:ferredoxin
VTLISEHGETHQFPCRAGSTVDEAAHAAGLDLPVVCRRGGCGACLADLIEGQVQYTRPVSHAKLRTAPNDENRCALMCRAIPVSDVALRPERGWTKRSRHPWSTLLLSGEKEG